VKYSCHSHCIAVERCNLTSCPTLRKCLLRAQIISQRNTPTVDAARLQRKAATEDYLQEVQRKQSIRYSWKKDVDGGSRQQHKTEINAENGQCSDKA